MIEALSIESLDIKLVSKNKVQYLDIESSFDIETTSMTLDDGTDVGFMYAWAFGIANEKHLAIGRTWEEFATLLDELTAYYHLGHDRRLVVYVHNLSYEFQFMRKYFEWKEVFTVDEREPIIALTTGGIEFRDSYILSGYSLDKTAKMLTNQDIEKLTGDLDYSLVRHHETLLTDKEKQYVINDVLIVLYYINEQRNLYGNITKIPITNTRRVRDYVRDNAYHNKPDDRKNSSYMVKERFSELISNLTLTRGTYLKANKAFQGGYVHANDEYLDTVLNDVVSYDITSSYPSVMVTEDYPMSEGKKVRFTKDKGYQYYLKNHVLIFDVKFTNLIRKKDVYEDYLSESKCFLQDPLINNGRVQGAKVAITTTTSVDFNIIKKVYDYDNVQFSNVYAFKRGHMPLNILKSIIALFHNKTTLKATESKELEAQLAKEMLNSTYGMMVTDVIKNKVEYNTQLDEWKIANKNPTQEINDYNNQKRRFLFYPWGIFVSAYARRNLWLAILALKEDYIYSDTDSVKFLNHDKHRGFFTKYNQWIDAKLQKFANDNQRVIEFEDFQPVSEDGEVEALGHFEIDGIYKRFKTIGAKMYLAETYEEELELTVAGLNKNQGKEYLVNQAEDNTEAFELFTNDMTIPKEHSGKMTHKYIDDEHTFEVTDYQGNTATVTALSGVYMEKSEFTINEIKLADKKIKELAEGLSPVGNERIN